jgi:hypothetical protein
MSTSSPGAFAALHELVSCSRVCSVYHEQYKIMLDQLRDSDVPGELRRRCQVVCVCVCVIALLASSDARVGSCVRARRLAVARGRSGTSPVAGPECW